MNYAPLPATCRCAVCYGCGHRQIIDADDDRPECPRCHDGLVIATRVHPRSHAVALMGARNPLDLG